MIIRCRAPVRISFGGGGSDVSPFTEKYGGAVVNATINKYAYATLKLRKDNKIILSSLDFNQLLTFNSIDEMKYDGNLDLIKAVIKNMCQLKSGFEIILSCEVPPRSGLGSSASAFAAVIGLFNRLQKEKRLDNYDLAELAYNLERKELKILGGRQDQYATIFGGLNYIDFEGDSFVKVNNLKVKEDYFLELEANSLLIYIGARGKSGDIIDDQTKNILNNENVMQAMLKTKQIAKEFKFALIRGDLQYFGELLDQAWELKKSFSSRISNSEIDALYKELKQEGVIGGKITGAGGGGHMFLYCKDNKKADVVKIVEKFGAKVIPFSFENQGLTSWVIENDK